MASIKNGAALAMAALAVLAFAADKKNEFRYTVGPRASVTVVNEFGPVNVKASPARQVVISATTHSDKVEVDSYQVGNRVEARTHFLQRTGDTEGRVDYEVLVPQDASVTVRASSGPIRAEKLRGDLTLEGDAAQIEVRDVGNAHVHLRTVNGPITVTNVTNGHVEINTVSGDVQLDSVSGPKVSVNTTRGNIRYTGDFGAGGEYSLVNHSGNIEVSLPATASVDITARSVKGSVEQDFPLREKEHPSFVVTPGRSFAGTSLAGSSSVRLSSFSGKIRVKKQ